jgi:hypothetical protein
MLMTLRMLMLMSQWAGAATGIVTAEVATEALTESSNLRSVSRR